MTIIGVAFTPKETFFFSDRLRYYLTENTAEDVLNHRLEIDHTNLKEHIETYETDAPKIHRITKNIALVSGGDGRFADMPEGLNTRKNIAKQILQRLKCKGKINAYWCCHIAQLGKLTSIVYKKGEIETKEQTTDNIWFDSFTPEIQEIFFKKYINLFYLAPTQEKIKIINEFFKEVTELFGGLAGGKAEIAILNERGFQWIRNQNFTNYSSTWCPEKIETSASSDWAIVNDNWQTILKLENFECDSTMLLFILAHAGEIRCSNDGVKARCYLSIDATSDDDQYESGLLAETRGYTGCDGHPSNNHYSVHSVKVLAKGLHTLRLHAKRYIPPAGGNVNFAGRRLTILKGFYQGGTT